MLLTRRHVLLGLGGSLFLLVHTPPSLAVGDKLKVVASFSILADMVARVGGSHIALSTLVGPDGDAHVYEPTPSAARALAAADVLVANGLGFERWLPRLVRASGFHGMEVAASDGVVVRDFKQDPQTAEAHRGHNHGSQDPHAWQDLSNGVIYVRNIAAALTRADPMHSREYEANAASYISELAALHDRTKAELAAIPEQRRRVVTSHDAFAYFGAAYGVTFVAPLGLSTEAEASPADVARLIDQIKQDNITALFIENIANAKLLLQIAQATATTVGGKLYSDALSSPSGPASTYVDLFKWNLAQLRNAMRKE